MAKKIFLLIGCFALLTMGIVGISCKKEEKKEWKGCTCTAKFDDGDKETNTWSAAELKEEGISSCSQLKKEILSDEDDIVSLTCSDL